MTTQNEFGFGSDFFSDVLEESPRASFFSFVNQQNQPQQRFFQNQFQTIQNEFLGNLGQQLREGNQPSQTFTDFLSDFPFSERFSALPPALRGALTNRFAPSIRFFL